MFSPNLKEPPSPDWEAGAVGWTRLCQARQSLLDLPSNAPRGRHYPGLAGETVVQMQRQGQQQETLTIQGPALQIPNSRVKKNTAVLNA